MDNLDKRAIIFMSSFTVLIYATVIIYSLSPILGNLSTENIGKGSEDRVLPFPFRWFDLPTSTTPYYEILFVIETLSAVHSGVCFCCFDNFLCILFMHVGGQFKILQNQLQTIMTNESSKDKSAGIYNEFKHCLKSHYALLSYVDKLEYVFCFPLMIQLLVSSVVLCVSGFQICLVDGIFMKRLLFLMYFLGGLIQIYLITLNCNDIMEESSAIGNAIYNSDWETKPYGDFYQIRKDMIIVMVRAKRPCYITAWKFFPISLESFTKVLSMTASYYTLLCTMESDVIEQ
ncbi:Odorant receptor 13a [Anthophora plagiata]